jgi:hypothetical protein
VKRAFCLVDIIVHIPLGSLDVAICSRQSGTTIAIGLLDSAFGILEFSVVHTPGIIDLALEL